jgi:anaerobic ribonucleoside-triphosphate reductase activating protein
MSTSAGKSADLLRVAATHPACTVLGPGSRYVVWVQGCPLSCPGCVSPQWIPPDGGVPTSVRLLAEQVATHAVDGLTLSGGEPFAQAAALARLVELVRERRDLSVLSYSGYTLRWLRRHGSPAQHRLLAQLDLLIDGRYRQDLHADLRWRGSSNQRLHCLTDRHRDELAGPDGGVGLQFAVHAESVAWLGVPPVPRFRERFEAALGADVTSESRLARTGVGTSHPPRASESGR